MDKGSGFEVFCDDHQSDALKYCPTVIGQDLYLEILARGMVGNELSKLKPGSEKEANDWIDAHQPLCCNLSNEMPWDKYIELHLVQMFEMLEVKGMLGEPA